MASLIAVDILPRQQQQQLGFGHDQPHHDAFLRVSSPNGFSARRGQRRGDALSVGQCRTM